MAAIARNTANRSGPRQALPAAAAMALLNAGLLVAWVVLDLTMPDAVPDTSGMITFVLPISALSAIGFLLMLLRPKNLVGGLLAGSGVLLSMMFLGLHYDFRWLYVRDLPQALLVPMAISGYMWALAVPLLLVMVPLLFPDGRLLSRRWRPVLWLAAAGGIVTLVAVALDPRSISDSHRTAPNPIGIVGAHDLLASIQTIGSVIELPLMVAAVTALGIRYHRADSDLRHQLRWFIAAVSATVAGVLVATITKGGTVGIAAFTIGLTAMPLSIGIAVLKYRLYDIDIVINRTVLFATMAGFITAVYLAVVVGVGTIVGSGARPSLVLSVLATAIVGAAFQPVYSRAQRLANRLAYGKRATPYEVLSQLSGHLVDAYAGDDLLPRVARTVAEATAATGVQVWVRVGSELRSAAVWPVGTEPSPLVPVSGQILPQIPGVDHALPVRYQGELLGAITLTKRAGESLSPMEQKLVGDLAGQAGLMLKNVGLTTDLRARLEDLRASRQRLVCAQDSERRRIERNLHDGAQQHLVALKIKVGLLEPLITKDAARAATLASEVKGEADEALETLRDLARGIYPPLLASEGLVAALKARARRAPLPVEVVDEGVVRYPPEIEAAVYFCCLEALQNVGKYARATTASIRLSVASGSLGFEVRDDGAGFDQGGVPAGSGLTGMNDRIDAVGGRLVVSSSPGKGTQVTGSLPVLGRKGS